MTLSQVTEAKAAYENAQSLALRARRDYEAAVRQAREAHTLQQIADVLGVTPQRVMQIGNGK